MIYNFQKIILGMPTSQNVSNEIMIIIKRLKNDLVVEQKWAKHGHTVYVLCKTWTK